MFEYATLVKNIPDQIVKSCKNCNYPTFENLKYVIPGKEKPVGVFQLETRDIYLALVWGGIHKRKSESYWQNKFNDVEIDFVIRTDGGESVTSTMTLEKIFLGKTYFLNYKELIINY